MVNNSFKLKTLYQGPYYLKNPFNQKPDFSAASINYDLEELLSRATLQNFGLYD